MYLISSKRPIFLSRTDRNKLAMRRAFVLFPYVIIAAFVGGFFFGG